MTTNNELMPATPCGDLKLSFTATIKHFVIPSPLPLLLLLPPCAHSYPRLIVAFAVLLWLKCNNTKGRRILEKCGQRLYFFVWLLIRTREACGAAGGLALLRGIATASSYGTLSSNNLWLFFEMNCFFLSFFFATEQKWLRSLFAKFHNV